LSLIHWQVLHFFIYSKDIVGHFIQDFCFCSLVALCFSLIQTNIFKVIWCLSSSSRGESPLKLFDLGMCDLDKDIDLDIRHRTIAYIYCFDEAYRFSIHWTWTKLTNCQHNKVTFIFDPIWPWHLNMTLILDAVTFVLIMMFILQYTMHIYDNHLVFSIAMSCLLYYVVFWAKCLCYKK
jgi:hypothetical protein